jgi:hypothetical protein
VFLADTGLDKSTLVQNLRLPKKLGHVEMSFKGASSTTYSGLDAAAEWRSRVSLADEHESIPSMEPRPRGRALQKLLAKVIEKHGWDTLEGVNHPTRRWMSSSTLVANTICLSANGRRVPLGLARSGSQSVSSVIASVCEVRWSPCPASRNRPAGGQLTTLVPGGFCCPGGMT